MLERYGEKYPDVMKVNASLQDASRQLQTELANAIEAIQQRLSVGAGRGADADGGARRAEGRGAWTSIARASATRCSSARPHSNRQVYEALLLREKELQVMANSRGNNVRVTDRAETPGAPFTPSPRRDLILAIVAGLALSLGLVFLLDYLNDTVKNPDDVTDKLEISAARTGAEGDAADGQLLLSQRRAARVRRGVPIAAHLVDLQQRVGGDPPRDGDERAAARRQDHDGVQSRAGSGDWRGASAADRCRHAASRRPSHAGHRERHRALARADRSGDTRCRRGDPREAESVGVDGRHPRRPIRQSCSVPSR